MKRALKTAPRIAAGTLAFVLCSLAGSQLLSSTSPEAAKEPVPNILIRPGIVYATSAAKGPKTTAYCEKTYHIACYEPFQIQRAYDEGPLFDKGIDGQGQTIIIVDCVRFDDRRSRSGGLRQELSDFLLRRH